MKVTTALRTVAIAIAIAAFVDPAVPIRRLRPIAVELVSGGGHDAESVRRRLLSELGADATVARSGHGDAIVIADSLIDVDAIRENVTVSAITLTSAPNVRFVRGAVSSPAVQGQEAAIDIDADVRGLAGRRSVITVTQNQIELGQIEHSWTAARRQKVSVPFVPLVGGTHRVRVAAAPLEEESRDDDNGLDVRISTVDRPLRIAFVEPRPSWSAGFVRRVIEPETTFEVASSVRASRGIAVRAGEAPAALTPATLERFDCVVVGAPEDLRVTDLDALRAFMAERGGTVFLLPDRRPSGPYMSLVSSAGFDEVLLASPVALRIGPSTGLGTTLRASEFAIPRTPDAALNSLASLADGRPAIVSRPIGDGRLIFSGALDAWRFRGDRDRFAAFWRASIAAAALTAPPRVRVDLDPPIVTPGVETRVVARLRRTELEHSADGSIRVPMVRAVVTAGTGGTGSGEPIRLWPTAEGGIFTGRFGLLDGRPQSVRASADGAHYAAALLEGESPQPVGGDDEEARIVASATGGVVAPANDLTPLVNHLRAVRRHEIDVTVHPMQSGWWTLPFTLALCAEWTLRRRRGER